MTWAFNNLTPLKYGVILADPAWRFLNWSAKGEKKNPVAHYKCMPLKEMKALPVNQLAAPNCALFMWATWPMIDQALELMKTWGFTYKTGGSWGKRSTTGRKWAFGPGYIVRSADEPWLIGTIGSPKVMNHSVRNLFVTEPEEHEWYEALLRAAGFQFFAAPRTPVHSQKPPNAHEIMETLYEGPRCELFSRSTRPGWEVWGDEVGKFD